MLGMGLRATLFAVLCAFCSVVVSRLRNRQAAVVSLPSGNHVPSGLGAAMEGNAANQRHQPVQAAIVPQAAENADDTEDAGSTERAVFNTLTDSPITLEDSLVARCDESGDDTGVHDVWSSPYPGLPRKSPPQFRCPLANG